MRAALRAVALAMAAACATGCVTVFDEDVGLQALVVREALGELPTGCRLGPISLQVGPEASARSREPTDPPAALLRRLADLPVRAASELVPGGGVMDLIRAAANPVVGDTTTEVLVSSLTRHEDDQASVSVRATCGGVTVESQHRFYRILGIWRRGGVS